MTDQSLVSQELAKELSDEDLVRLADTACRLVLRQATMACGPVSATTDEHGHVYVTYETTLFSPDHTTVRVLFRRGTSLRSQLRARRRAKFWRTK